MFISLLLIIMITYFAFPDFVLSEDTAILYGLEINGMCNDKPCHIGEFSFAGTSYVVLCWLGMISYTIFGGVGLVVMPYDYMMEFVFRPKLITPQMFTKRKKVLLPMILKLRKKSKHLEDDRILVDAVRGISGFIKRSQFAKEMRVWET